MGLFLSTAGNNLELWGVIGKLVVQVLLPVVLGMLLHARFGEWSERHRKGLRYFDQSIILLIVYTSFCESFDKHMFDGFSMLRILGIGASMIILFALIFGMITLASRIFRFNRADRITRHANVYGVVRSGGKWCGTA